MKSIIYFLLLVSIEGFSLLTKGCSFKSQNHIRFLTTDSSFPTATSFKDKTLYRKRNSWKLYSKPDIKQEDNRRIFFQKLVTTSSSFIYTSTITSSFPSIAKAYVEKTQGTSPALPNKTFVKGIVTLKGVENFPQNSDSFSSAALYITARPNKVDVNRAIQDGSNGKSPPVLTARIPEPRFPHEFSLSSLDLTQEGAAVLDDAKFWFEGMDLTISARWDTDGVASTRDPTDLVGRSMFVAKLGLDDGQVVVPLTGRGFTGKIVTGKGKKR